MQKASSSDGLFRQNGNHYKSQMVTNKSSKKSYYFNSTGQLATGKTKIGKNIISLQHQMLMRAEAGCTRVH